MRSPEPRSFLTGLTDSASLGLAIGFFAWMIGEPRVADPLIVRTTQRGLLAGLPVLLVAGQVGALVISGVLSLWSPLLEWRARLPLASCGLYFAATSAALGRPGLAVGALVCAAWLVGLWFRGDRPGDRLVVLSVHVGCLCSALAFFHQWAWYRLAWSPFTESLRALASVLVGG
jgi:hypothetical protein